MAKGNKNLNTDSRITYPVRLLSLEGACKYLSCSSDRLEDLIALGCFNPIRFPPEPKPGKKDRRKRWIDIVEIDEFIEIRKKCEK